MRWKIQSIFKLFSPDKFFRTTFSFCANDSEYTNGCMKKITKTQKFQNTLNFQKKLVSYKKKSFLAILGPKKANFMILGNFHGFLQNFQKKRKLQVPLA